MDKATITSIVQKYKENLEKHVQVERVYVYGSHASGTATSESDIDMIVVSNDFSLLEEDERQKIVYRSTVGLPYDFHIIGVTNKELTQASRLTTLGSVDLQQSLAFA